MIDFINPEYIKLTEMDQCKAEEAVRELLITEEKIEAAFRTVRDKVIFTSKRIITVNIQGATGKRVDYTTLPYKKIQAFSIKTVALTDMDSELNIWISNVGKIHFEIASGYDIKQLSKLLSQHVL